MRRRRLMILGAGTFQLGAIEAARSLGVDTVVLSNFALAGRFGLLVTRYGPRALITPEVRDEITDGVVAGYSRLCEVEDPLVIFEPPGIEDFIPCTSVLPVWTKKPCIYRVGQDSEPAYRNHPA